MTFAVLLTGNPVNAMGKGIQGGNGVSIVINSKFIPITTGLDPEKHTFKKVENFTVDSPSKNQLIDKVWDLQTIKRIKY